MFDNMTEEEIAIMLQDDPERLQKVKAVKELLDLFNEMTQEQKARLIAELRPSCPAVADAFTEILSMDGGDPGGAAGVQSVP